MISKEQFLAIKRCQSEGMSMAAAAKKIGIIILMIIKIIK